MPSHLDPEGALPAGLSRCDVLGNKHADEEAGLAAHSHALPLHVTHNYLRYYTLVRQIQRRLIALLCALLHRSYTARFQHG